MAIKYSDGRTTSSAKLKVLVSALVGLATLFIAGNMLSWKVAPLLSWDTAAVTFACWTWLTVWPLNGRLTAAHAVREDPSRTVADVLVLAASLASLAAVVVVLETASSATGLHKLLLVAFGAASVVIGWAMLHTVFTLHYAEKYYRNKPGGVDFPDTPEPSYKDFTYLAFTVGMTFQVSDTAFQTTEFRRLALRHSLMSYLFGTVIVATTINLIAGLTK